MEGKKYTAPLDAYEVNQNLPRLRPYAFAAQQSSHDRMGGNNDGWGEGQFLYTDPNGEKVMLDVKGAGKLNRLWFAGAWDHAQSRIHFYFDGESEPRISVPFGELFSGNTPPFLKPLVGDAQVSSGGNFCYVTLTFSKGLKITAVPVGKDFFYHVGYELFAPEVPVTTWPHEDVNSSWVSWLQKNNELSSSGQSNSNALLSGSVCLPGKTASIVAQLEGPASLNAIRLSIPELVSQDDRGMDTLNRVWLKIYWDEEEDPSIHAPIGSLFGMGQFGLGLVQTPTAGIDDNGDLYLNLPAPFRRSARVELVNAGEKDIPEIRYVLTCEPIEDSLDGLGYLRTCYSDLEPRAGDGSDYTVLDVQGMGHVVGIVQSFAGDKERRYLEGDERIYIDDSRTPVWIGTGTEDLYGGGGYFIHGPFTLPFHGNPVHIEDELDKTTAYRFFINDPIPFRSRVLFMIEHGSDLNWDAPEVTGTNNANVDVQSLVFYYHTPEPCMHLSDRLVIGSPNSERTHSYQNSGELWRGSLNGTYEGNEEDVVISDWGCKWSGSCEFVLRLCPANEGVVVRRTFDQAEQNGRAAVYVDGVLAGIWYRAGSNPWHVWRDDDFLISSELTMGKEEIRIKLELMDKDHHWSEFAYEAYSIGKRVSANRPLTAMDSSTASFGQEIPFTPTLPDGDFTFICQFVLPEPQCDTDVLAGGVVLREDNDGGSIELCRINEQGNSRFELSKWLGSQCEVQKLPDNAAETALYLRFTRIGNYFTAFYSTNGNKFTRVGTFVQADFKAMIAEVFIRPNKRMEAEAKFDSLRLIVHEPR
ncbi:hypothetical protein A8709_32785 [Paenibacillus pectinilyticus]|uniref:DUF2961 domain-containing protein n=1 Tax=Paenibacillus pectinilyticus TaxID=512399 RepID=A0A1C0ZWV5_9BACL|nr:DUF2961 domain-containing protein [Paenibacillus pectinilyticus]OCT12592.1 hypothetical protein A8709_32785 [Paenibacillus pectinilyticus]